MEREPSAAPRRVRNANPGGSEQRTRRRRPLRATARVRTDREGVPAAVPGRHGRGTEYSDGEGFALTDDAVDIGETGVLAVRGGGRTALPDGFVRHDVFRTGAGLFVSEPLADAGVEALAMADVLAMFEGDATNWREFGGPDREINLLAAPFGNPGSRFQRTVLSGVERDGIDEVADRDGRVKAVASRDDAVARFPFPDIDAIRSNGVGDTYRIDAVVDGARRGPDEVGYPGTWAVPLFTNGDPDPRERAFLDALSHEAVLNWLTARTLDGDVLRTFPVADPPKY